MSKEIKEYIEQNIVKRYFDDIEVHEPTIEETLLLRELCDVKIKNYFSSFFNN